MPRSNDKHIADPSLYFDRSNTWREYFDKKRRTDILNLIQEHPEIIEEHANNPLGYRNHPSHHLQRLHNYFRMQPTFGKYYIYTEEAWSVYRIAKIQEFGEFPILHGEFRTEEEAMHAVFLQRIQDLRDDVE